MMASGSQNLTSDKARILSTQPGTDKFWRGDNSWSDTFNGVLLLPRGLRAGDRVNNTGAGIEICAEGGIEIFHTSTPYIDFHYEASTDDYSVRLICDSATNLTCTGAFTVKGNIEGDAGIIGNRNQWGLDMYARPFAHHATNPSSTNGANLYYAAGNQDYYDNPRWYFLQYSYTASSTATNGYYEAYRLPATAAGLTANATYEIRTSKSSAYTVDNASACTGNSYGLLSNNTSQAAENCYDGAPGLHFWRYNGSSGQSGGDGWIAQWSWNSGSVGGQIYLDDNPSYTIMIRGRNSDADHTFNAWKRIQLCDGTGASGTWGISITGNAATASKVGGATSWLYFNNSNEVNFGGTNTSADIYFGYRATDSRPKPTTFHFGTDSATVKAATFNACNGYLISTCNGNTVNIGSQNSGWCHIYNSASIPFIFNNTVCTTTGDLGTASYPFDNLILKSGGRVSGNGGNLYIGNSNNANWVLTQDICSHNGTGDTYWSLRITGVAHFKTAYGAVWNDYAEMRNVPKAQIDIYRINDDKGEIERNYPYAGHCVYEIGDGTMELTNARLAKGCKIISDTFGFCIGETEDCRTPIAVTGRVLAYPYENIEEYKNHIGDCVCSGPNGTISIMTLEETIQHPECIVGTISEIPTYAIWRCGNKDTKPINVNGRIWIYVH